jgi:hypothetical protein
MNAGFSNMNLPTPLWRGIGQRSKVHQAGLELKFLAYMFSVYRAQVILNTSCLTAWTSTVESKLVQGQEYQLQQTHLTTHLPRPDY